MNLWHLHSSDLPQIYYDERNCHSGRFNHKRGALRSFQHLSFKFCTDLELSSLFSCALKQPFINIAHVSFMVLAQWSLESTWSSDNQFHIQVLKWICHQKRDKAQQADILKYLSQNHKGKPYDFIFFLRQGIIWQFRPPLKSMQFRLTWSYW